MQHLLVVAALATVIQLSSCSYGFGCSWRGVECIDYEVVSNDAEYEERLYPETKWISVTSRGMSLFEAKVKSFRKLIYYIQAFNDQNVTVDLTTPHRTFVHERGASGKRMSDYTMAFPLPLSLYHNPPKANDKEVFIHTEPPRRYIVKVFGGKPSEQEWLRHADDFVKSVRRDPSIVTDSYYIARYDLLFWIHERRNEIWLVKN
ncbi:heme-binding protein 1-like [Ornithodoros turicata]|uniref:heme-binding protein 1-like n=1 Tax=Ornithodoros turicata TaxID=34597 RepID=UPI0031397FF9